MPGIGSSLKGKRLLSEKSPRGFAAKVEMESAGLSVGLSPGVAKEYSGSLDLLHIQQVAALQYVLAEHRGQRSTSS